jgi:site-specific recombinase XerD
MSWRVFWVPRDAARHGVRASVLAGWNDLSSREDEAGVSAGDPIFLSPDWCVDGLLSLYGQSGKFRGYTAETKRNYATDIALLLTMLWERGKQWTEATGKDLADYEHWRRFATGNPQRIGGSKWDREQAAFASLYAWAKDEHRLGHSPVTVPQVIGRRRANDARPSNVHWLTPRTWRLWTDVGLRGHTRDGIPERGWIGRLEERNIAFVRMLTSSGLRRQEAGSLLTFEVPAVRLPGGRYYRGRVASATTRSKRDRTFYVSASTVGDIETYMESSRAWAIRRAQRKGRYERLPERWLVTEVTRGLKPKVHWRDQDGVEGAHELSLLTVEERMLLFTEGPDGPEPLWLWLNQQGMPFAPHSWEGVFRTANQRCEQVLTPPHRLGKDPYQVYAPYATPHSARHSFALFMLIVLDEVMDQRYGLTPEERRDFRLLYGDPWFMVQGLLGHASRDTTVDRYLSPVRNLQLESMLVAAAEPLGAPMPSLDGVFARVAQTAEEIQDIDVRMEPRVEAGA